MQESLPRRIEFKVLAPLPFLVFWPRMDWIASWILSRRDWPRRKDKPDETPAWPMKMGLGKLCFSLTTVRRFLICGPMRSVDSPRLWRICCQDMTLCRLVRTDVAMVSVQSRPTGKGEQHLTLFQIPGYWLLSRAVNTPDAMYCAV